MKFKTKAKRFLAALLIAAAVLGPTAPAYAVSAGDFKDVSGGDWFYNAVDFVVGRGLFNGSSATMFNPNGRMTRGMFITVLGRYAGVDPAAWLTGTVTGSGVNLRSGPGTGYDVVATLSLGANAEIKGKSGGWYQVQTDNGTGYVSGDYLQPDYHSFSDVDYGQYYAGYAVWAYEKGVVNGVGSEFTFSPDSNITREQLCTMLGRFASVMGAGLAQNQGAVTFSDSGSISSWAADSVTAMQRSGVVQGDESGAFRPRGSATRAETAAMLQRFESACGGFSAPDQNPPPKQSVTPESGSGGTTPPAGEEQSTPPGGENQSTPPGTDQNTNDENTGGGDGQYPPDTPAALIGGTVPTQGSVIRVGLYYKTNGYDTSVDSVTLQNLSGTGFDLGTMPGRDFSYETSIPDSTVTITTDGACFTVSAASGTYTYGSCFAIRPANADRCLTNVNGGYNYYGAFEARVAMNGKINLINIVDFEDYVKGVVPFEFSTNWPMEAMKAAAVVCRSYAMSYNWGTYAAYGMDILSGSNCQIYQGKSAYSDVSDAAVEATRNLYLTCDGSICMTAYSSCDGGATRSSQEVFGTYYSYLVGKADPYEQAVAGQINNYDSWVSVSHKVGMSAWGCYAMANNFGKTYDAILGFYFTGTSLQYGA